MANPFTAFAFPASGTPTPPCSPNSCNRTLPDRLAQVINIKDCGGVGDGATDNLPAITTALNVVAGRNKGTIYFPPGTYLVSAPITWAASQGGVNTVHWLGEPGLSVITGNFSDFIFKYNGGDIFNIWEKLTISNTNATGGGIGISSDSNNQAIRDCVFICNQGINGVGLAGGTPLDGTVESCTFSAPVGGVTNSYGAAIPWNGPIANCTFTGLDYGLLVFGQEGSMNIIGCRFEQCGVGFAPGISSPAVGVALTINSGTYVSATGIITIVLSATPIFNGGTLGLSALSGTGAFASLVGGWVIQSISGATVVLEGPIGAGAATITSGTASLALDNGSLFLLGGCYFKNCSTGINFHGGSGGCTIAGIRIEGTNGQARLGADPQYGIFSDRGQPGNAMFAGVIVTGQYDMAAVHLGTGANFTECNFMGISAANSGAGAAWDLPSPITVLLPTFSSCNKSISYPVATLPSSANEGDEYNVSDGTASLAWGAAVTGGHSTHYLVRNNSTTPASPNFTVVGQ